MERFKRRNGIKASHKRSQSSQSSNVTTAANQNRRGNHKRFYQVLAKSFCVDRRKNANYDVTEQLV